MKNIRLAVIGCGSRGTGVVKNFLKAADGKAAVSCVYDVDDGMIAKALTTWNAPGARRAASLEDAAKSPDSDLVCIFTPNYLHCEAILAALAAGKRVFSEKPLATTLEDCERIMAAEKAAGIPIMTGFVLRYSPIYRKVHELISGGSFGKIVNVAASENRESWGGGNSMSADYGWRRFREQAGPYLLEKCSHDLDLLNWFAGAVPTRVAAFCGLDYFVPANAALWDKFDRDNFAKMVPESHRINPFTSEKTIFDNHTVIMEYPGGIKMNFQLTLANAIPERRMYICCTEGTIIAECFAGTVKYRRYDEPYSTELKFAGGGHGGGDGVMAKEIMASLLNDAPLNVSGSANGLMCARVALAADESARTGRIVAL
jgi:predicted dehydrogenase